MPASPLTRSDALVALALAALVFVTGSWQMAPGVCGACHDDAIYVSTAKALAAGEGYRLIDVPGSPPQTKYPIGYPALLAVVWTLWPSFPANVILMQVLTLVSSSAAVALGYLYLVRFDYFPRVIAAGAGSLCATAPTFLYYSVQTMAEMPFALAAIGALWGVELALAQGSAKWRVRNSSNAEFGMRNAESADTPHSAIRIRHWQQFAIGVLIALPFLFRTIGATLIVGGLCVWWWRGRPLRWTVAGVLTVALPWMLWSLAGRGDWQRDPVEGYYTDYVGQWSIHNLSYLGTVVFSNALYLLYGSGNLALEGTTALVKPGLGSVTTLLVMVPGLAAWLAMIPGLRKGRLLPWVLIAYLSAMLLWSWHPCRFLVPILPCLTAYLLSAPVAALSRLKTNARWQHAGLVGLALLVLANGALLTRYAEVILRTGYPLANITDTQAEWSAYQRVFAWLEQHTEKSDVIACGLDSMVGLYTGRQSFRPVVYNPGQLFYGQSAPRPMDQELAAILAARRPRYLAQMPMPGHPWEIPLMEAIAELRRKHPSWLVVVYQDADPRFVVYELDGRANPSGEIASAR